MKRTSQPVQPERPLVELSPLLLSPEEAARVLAVSRTRIYELISAGEISSVRAGRLRRVVAASLPAWVDRQLDEGS